MHVSVHLLVLFSTSDREFPQAGLAVSLYHTEHRKTFVKTFSVACEQRTNSEQGRCVNPICSPSAYRETDSQEPLCLAAPLLLLLAPRQCCWVGSAAWGWAAGLLPALLGAEVGEGRVGRRPQGCRRCAPLLQRLLCWGWPGAVSIPVAFLHTVLLCSCPRTRPPTWLPGEPASQG